MRIYFAGAETPSWRNMLAKFDAEAAAMSFIGLTRRVKHTDQWDVAEHFPDSMSIMLDSGAFSLNKKKDLDHTEVDELYRRYHEFAAVNSDRFEIISEFDVNILSASREGNREQGAELYGAKFMPVWHVDEGLEALRTLGSSYGRVGMVQAEADALATDYSTVVRELAQDGVKLHGVSMTRKRSMEALPWDSVGSMSWLSPSQYGDTFVWNGQSLKRHPVKYKDEVRKGRRYRQYLEEHGFDTEAIADDDTDEVLRLSVWSWQEYVRHINVVTANRESDDPANVEPGSEVVGDQDDEAWNSQLVRPEPRQHTLLPILGMGTADDEGTERPLIEGKSTSLRQCNNCFIRRKCPGARKDAECMYEIPAEIKTTAQLSALAETAIGIQWQRVAFMRLIEEAEGGMLADNLSVEIDRLMRMIKTHRESQREGFNLNISASQTSGDGQGMLTKFFGGEAAGKATALPAPIDSNKAIAESMEEPVEGEVVDEDSNSDD